MYSGCIPDPYPMIYPSSAKVLPGQSFEAPKVKKRSLLCGGVHKWYTKKEGLFHGTSEHKIDDLYRGTPISGNLQMENVPRKIVINYPSIHMIRIVRKPPCGQFSGWWVHWSFEKLYR